MIKIYGHSDDVVCVDRANPDSEEFDSFDRSTILKIGSDKEGLIVTMRYGAHEHSGDTWSAEIEMIEEGTPVPWDISWKVEDGKYTGILSIYCPTDTPIVRIGDGEG
jgi:hypothetical protein